jgi:hypothetical protein
MPNTSSRIHQLEIDNARRKALETLGICSLLGAGVVGCGSGSSSSNNTGNTTTNYGSSAKSTVISQMAFPAEITTAVYNSELYSSKGQNTSVKTFAADNIFNDGVEYQLATVTGSVADGLVAELEVGIDV